MISQYRCLKKNMSEFLPPNFNKIFVVQSDNLTIFFNVERKKRKNYSSTFFLLVLYKTGFIGISIKTIFYPPCSFVTGLWFSLGTPVSSSNKTDRHNITEMLLKVSLNTITNNPIHTVKNPIN